MYSVFEQGQWYCVRQLHRYDFVRQSAYQRLRADIFVKQLGWELPMDERGRERDRYDEMNEGHVQIACVYGRYRYTEHLLGGVRIHNLGTWDDSMTVNEFHQVDMIPSSVVNLLKDRYNPTDLLEVTRMCLRRGRTYKPSEKVHKMPLFQLDVARDLIYAAVFTQVELSKRQQVLFIVDRYYLQIMRHSHFVFEELYSYPQGEKRGYSLIVLDFLATLFAIEEAGAHNQVRRVLSLYT